MAVLKKIRLPFEVWQTKSRRWRTCLEDWMHVHWATFWSSVGAGFAYFLSEIQTNIGPHLQNLGLWGVIGAALIGFITQMLIQLMQGQKAEKGESDA